jgi:hypothetical protein
MGDQMSAVAIFHLLRACSERVSGKVGGVVTGPACDSPQVMRSNMLQARSLAAILDYVPHDILRDASSPYLSPPGDGSECPSLPGPGCSYPLIERCFNLIWNRVRRDRIRARSWSARCAARRGSSSDDLLRRLALPRPVEHEPWLTAYPVCGLPVLHCLVHPPSVEIRCRMTTQAR